MWRPWLMGGGVYPRFWRVISARLVNLIAFTSTPHHSLRDRSNAANPSPLCYVNRHLRYYILIRHYIIINFNINRRPIGSAPLFKLKIRFQLISSTTSTTLLFVFFFFILPRTSHLVHVLVVFHFVCSFRGFRPQWNRRRSCRRRRHLTRGTMSNYISKLGNLFYLFFVFFSS